MRRNPSMQNRTILIQCDRALTWLLETTHISASPMMTGILPRILLQRLQTWKKQHGISPAIRMWLSPGCIRWWESWESGWRQETKTALLFEPSRRNSAIELTTRFGLDAPDPSSVPVIAAALDPRYKALKFLTDEQKKEVKAELHERCTAMAEFSIEWSCIPWCGAQIKGEVRTINDGNIMWKKTLHEEQW